MVELETKYTYEEGKHMDLNIVQRIIDETDKKVISSDCKKTSRKLCLKSVKDTGIVTELALWLYIFGYMDYAILVVDILGSVKFDGNYTFWGNGRRSCRAL